MTHLERLIQHQVAASTVATVSRTVDAVAEAFAQELLKDEAFKAELRRVILSAFQHTVTELRQEEGEA